MNVDLILNANNLYEIWSDRDCINTISRNKGETGADYKARAEREFGNYVDRLRAINAGKPTGQARTVKSVTI